MIFGRGQILFIFCAFVFALQFSTLNAYYLNNNGYDVALKDDEGCDGCAGYKCKLKNGESINGKDCPKKVKNICGIQEWDEPFLNDIDYFYAYRGRTFVIYSCKIKNDEMGEEEDLSKFYMNLRFDKNCDVIKLSYAGEYIHYSTKCIFQLIERDYIKPFGEARNALNNVKTEILKTIDEAKKVANETKKFGEYFKKKANEIAKKAENVSTIISDVDEMLKTLNESYSVVQKKCAEFNKTSQICIKHLGCEFEKYDETFENCKVANNETKVKAKDYLSKAKELMEPINEIKAAKEEVFMQANVAFTAENAQKLAKEAKRIVEEAKKEAKESKEIGENSNKTANFAVEIGMEAKMAANESMKTGNEANQKALEVEKLAKDSMNLAETNQKASDKTEAEVQKLKSNGEKIGSKFGIFVISLFAFIFLA